MGGENRTALSREKGGRVSISLRDLDGGSRPRGEGGKGWRRHVHDGDDGGDVRGKRCVARASETRRRGSDRRKKERTEMGIAGKSELRDLGDVGRPRTPRSELRRDQAEADEREEKKGKSARRITSADV